MSATPSPERPGDVLPGPEEFASWPRRGARALDLPLGPFDARLAGCDDAVARSLARWAAPRAATLGSPVAGGVSLELTRPARAGYLVERAGDRLRTKAWRAEGALVAVLARVALLLDASSGRGLVALPDQDDAELDRSLQNLLRIATAWRLLERRLGLLLHASAALRDGAAVLFVGPSGAGKTSAVAAPGADAVIADDVTVAVRGDDGWEVVATPFFADLARSGRVEACSRWPLRAAFRLERGEPACERLDPAAAAAALAAHAPFAHDVGLGEPALGAAADLSARHVVARLAFDLHEGPWVPADRIGAPSPLARSRG